jgi:internalin A
MPAGPASRPWRRYLRVSVRGLIVLVLVIGAGLGWIVHQAHVQRDAVAAIERAGGEVMYDWQWKGGRPDPNGKPGWPKWLVDLVGVDYLGHVSVVVGKGLSDAELLHIGRLDRLDRRLNLNDSSITDAGLMHLRGLKNLRNLHLARTAITDAGLSHLAELDLLELLTLDRCTVSDAGLVHLEGLTRLQSLNLPETRIGDAGVAHLTGLIHLRRLNLTDTQVTDAGMKELKQALPNLTIIH